MINFIFLLLLFLALIGLLRLIRSNRKQEKFIKCELETQRTQKEEG
ncbi:hypothetical protein [Antarcticibacterium arcticum]|nr:hypothetical protein [Antarcticibacterium arcticum]